MPLVNKTFNQLIDFTRTSAATYVDATGKIVPTPASRNLLTFTQEFDNAAWTKSGATVYPFDPATATQGPELVTNGNFSGGATGWTLGDWVISSGQASATATSTSLYGGQFTPVAGRVYRVEFDIISYASGTLSVTVGGNFTTNVNLTGAAAAPGRKSVFVTAGSTPARAVEFYGGSVTATIDNISVKELSGGLIAAPDGTLTADKVVEDGTTNQHRVNATYAFANTSTHTLSVYAKAAERSWLRVNNGSDNLGAWFNLSTGAVGAVSAGATASITPVGNGWYRCAVTFSPATAAAKSMAFNLGSADNTISYLGDGTSGIYLWGAQLEAASAATDYTRNVGGVYPPRFDYDPVTLAPKGLLVEEQRTNLVRYSEQFDNVYWPPARVTVTANATTSPDGTTDADKLVEDTSNNTHVVYTYPGTPSGTSTLSVYAKPAGRDWVCLETDAAGTRSFFNVATGTLGTVGLTVTATITAAGNGWYRCTITGSLGLGAGVYFGPASANNVASYTGDGTSGIFIWGAQLEAGAFATSYIPTVASQVTRTADRASIVAPNFAPWYNQSEGTFMVEYSRYQNVQFGVAIETKEAGAGSTANRLVVAPSATADPRVQNNMGGSSVLDTANTFAVLPANTVIKVATAYKSGDNAAVRNGGTPVTSATTFAAQNYTNLQIGQTDNTVYGGTAPFSINGHIRSIKYFPTRLSNAQLQALTA